jgi:predicted N-acetyltransferase YhbS
MSSGPRPVDVRPARIDDAPALAALSEQLGYPTPVAGCVERLRTLLAADRHEVLVACSSCGEVLGWVHVFVALRVQSEPFAELGGLVVAASEHGRGIGRRLVEHAGVWAAHHAAVKLRVRSRTSRQAAHGFYARLGFIRTKEQLVLDRRL